MMQLARQVALIGALVAGIATGALAQGFDKVFEAYSNGKVAEAVKGFKALAGQGDARAQQMLGRAGDVDLVEVESLVGEHRLGAVAETAPRRGVDFDPAHGARPSPPVTPPRGATSASPRRAHRAADGRYGSCSC